MTDLKITKGKMLSKIDADDFGVEYDGFQPVRWRYLGTKHNDPVVIVLKASNEDCVEEIKANAELVAEAFNVSNETGLTPRELLAENEKLKKQIDRLLESCTM